LIDHIPDESWSIGISKPLHVDEEGSDTILAVLVTVADPDFERVRLQVPSVTFWSIVARIWRVFPSPLVPLKLTIPVSAEDWLGSDPEGLSYCVGVF